MQVAQPRAVERGHAHRAGLFGRSKQSVATLEQLAQVQLQPKAQRAAPCTAARTEFTRYWKYGTPRRIDDVHMAQLIKTMRLELPGGHGWRVFPAVTDQAIRRAPSFYVAVSSNTSSTLLTAKAGATGQVSQALGEKCSPGIYFQEDPVQSMWSPA